MLVEFSTGNYLSIKDRVTLSLIAAKIKSRNKKLNEENLFSISGLKLLKSAAIYGANASGKTNLLQAIGFMRSIILHSSKDMQSGERIDVDNFKLSNETDGQPSLFEMIFFVKKRRYRYGFTLDKKEIHSEWLYHVPTSREAMLFHRDKGDFHLSTQFKEGKGIPSKTRSNALFLSVVSQFNGPISMSIFNWMRDFGFISGLSDSGYRGYTINKIDTDKKYKERIISFVRQMDTGVSNIRTKSLELTEEEKREFRVVTKIIQELEKEEVTIPESRLDVFAIHKKFDSQGKAISEVEFDFNTDESEGTQKLLYLMGPIVDTLTEGTVLVVDELDARFHPKITCSIIKLFNSNNTNPNNAQLIFATHDTNLLSSEYFRRDQIWFTEKDNYGATDLYSLAEIKVRNDASFEKDYISGKYGAIPFIGNIEDIIREDNE